MVSSQAASQSSATSTAQVQFILVMEGLSRAIQESKLDPASRDELTQEIAELKSVPEPSPLKIKAFATKLFKKLQEIGENVAIGVICKWLESQKGQ